MTSDILIEIKKSKNTNEYLVLNGEIVNENIIVAPSAVVDMEGVNINVQDRTNIDLGVFDDIRNQTQVELNENIIDEEINRRRILTYNDRSLFGIFDWMWDNPVLMLSMTGLIMVGGYVVSKSIKSEDSLREGIDKIILNAENKIKESNVVDSTLKIDFDIIGNLRKLTINFGYPDFVKSGVMFCMGTMAVRLFTRK